MSDENNKETQVAVAANHVSIREMRDEAYYQWYKTLDPDAKAFVDANFPPPSDTGRRQELLNQAMVRFAKARQAIIMNRAFFADLILKPHDRFVWPDEWELYHMNHTAGNVPEKTICINDEYYIMNPVWVNNIDLKSLCAHIVNLIMKPALCHVQRAGGRDLERWGRSSDSVTSDITMDALKMVPDDIRASFIDKYKGKNVEFIYDNLKERQCAGGQGGKPSNNGGGEGNGEGEIPSGLGSIMGSGSGGMAIQLNPSTTAERSSSEWMRSLMAATTNAERTHGYMPAGIKIMIDEFLKPKVRWQDFFRNFLTSFNDQSDYCTNRPNRNYIHMDVYLPSLYNEIIASGVFIIDTSGSCGAYQQKFLSEAAAAMNNGGGVNTIHMISCDADAYYEGAWNTFENPPKPFDTTGGGGTSFVPPFELIRKMRLQPEFVVYLTDMYGDFPDKKLNPGCPVLWMSTTPLDHIDTDDVKFGIVHHINLDD